MPKYKKEKQARIQAEMGNKISAMRILREANQPDIGLSEAHRIVESWFPEKKKPLFTDQVVKLHRMAGDLREHLNALAVDLRKNNRNELAGSVELAAFRATEILQRLNTVITDL